MQNAHTHREPIHPVHALILAFPIALFSGTLLADVAYLRTAEIQWTNFAQWLNAFALVFGGLVAAWALLSLLLHLKVTGRGRRVFYFVVLAAMWALGLVNAFKHSQDAWSSVGAVGLTLSIICAMLALVAGFVAYSGLGSRRVAA